jgi:hypothetical protein
MAKLAERIKKDLMKEIDVFKDDLSEVVEKCVRERGACVVDLYSDTFRTGWDSRSMSDVRVPKQYTFYIENEYSFQGFKIDKLYTPMGSLHGLRIHL